MKAAVLHGKEDVRIERVDIPALGPDHAFMRVPHAEGPFVRCARPSPGRPNADVCEPR